MQARSCLLQSCRSSLWCGLCSQVPVCFRWWKLAISLWTNICSSEKINSSSWNTGMTFTILLKSQFLFFYQLCEENWSRLGKSSLGPAPREGGVFGFLLSWFSKTHLRWKLSGTSKPPPLQESNLAREEARVGRRLPCGPHRPSGWDGRIPRWISAPPNRGCCTG